MSLLREVEKQLKEAKKRSEKVSRENQQLKKLLAGGKELEFFIMKDLMDAEVPQ